MLIKPTQSGHIRRPSKLPNETRHQKKIGFDDDVMYEVEYQTRKCQFGEQSQTTDYKSKVADDQVRENTAEIIFDDGSEGPGQYGHNTDAHEQKLDGVIRHKDQGKHPQKPVYSHLGLKPFRISPWHPGLVRPSHILRPAGRNQQQNKDAQKAGDGYRDQEFFKLRILGIDEASTL